MPGTRPVNVPSSPIGLDVETNVRTIARKVVWTLSNKYPCFDESTLSSVINEGSADLSGKLFTGDYYALDELFLVNENRSGDTTN